MNWANAMAGNADSAADAANNRVVEVERDEHGPPAVSWDPHEVWLNRVKRPRDDRHFQGYMQPKGSLS